MRIVNSFFRVGYIYIFLNSKYGKENETRIKAGRMKKKIIYLEFSSKIITLKHHIRNFQWIEILIHY